jgi:hypothetical protein
MEGENMKLPAMIRFLTTEEGGRKYGTYSGYRPHLEVNGELISICILTADPANEKFELGVEYKVYIMLIFEKEYLHMLDITKPIEIFETKHLVATGYFINESDEKRKI